MKQPLFDIEGAETGDPIQRVTVPGVEADLQNR